MHAAAISARVHSIIPNSRVDVVVDAVESFAALVDRTLQSGTADSAVFTDLKYVAELLQEPYSSNETAAIFARLSHIKATLPGKLGTLETAMEMAQIRTLLAAPQMSLSDFVMYDKYLNLVRKEWDLLNRVAKPGDLTSMRFAFVGCGAMPMTAIGLAKTHGIRIDCYDMMPEAVTLASQMIRRLDLANKISVRLAQAIDIDYSIYDIVFIANLVQPRMPVLQTLSSFKNIRAIITRRINGLASLLYSSLAERDLDGIGLVQHCVGQDDDTSVCQSLMLKIKDTQPD